MAFCRNCGNRLGEGDMFCAVCGTKTGFTAQTQAATPVPQSAPMEEIVPVAAQKLSSWETDGGFGQRFSTRMTTGSSQGEFFAEVPRMIKEHPKAIELFGVHETATVDVLSEMLLQRIVWRTLPAELQKATPEPILSLSQYVELHAKDSFAKAIDDKAAPMINALNNFTDRANNLTERMLNPFGAKKKGYEENTASVSAPSAVGQLSALEYKAFIAMESWAVKKIVYDGVNVMLNELQLEQSDAGFMYEVNKMQIVDELATLEVWFKQGNLNLWGPIIPKTKYERIKNELFREDIVRYMLKRICKKLDIDFDEISSKGAYKASYSVWWGGITSGGINTTHNVFSLLEKITDEGQYKDAMTYMVYNAVVEKFLAEKTE